MAIGFGAVSGQLIGGVLIKLDFAGLGWRPTFLINVPVGAASAPAPRLARESRARSAARIDLIGAALVPPARDRAAAGGGQRRGLAHPGPGDPRDGVRDRADAFHRPGEGEAGTRGGRPRPALSPLFVTP